MSPPGPPTTPPKPPIANPLAPSKPADEPGLPSGPPTGQGQPPNSQPSTSRSDAPHSLTTRPGPSSLPVTTQGVTQGPTPSSDNFRAAGAFSHLSASSTLQSTHAQAASRSLLTETNTIGRALEHLGRMLFSSGVFQTQGAFLRSSQVRGQAPATLELPFQGLVKMLSNPPVSNPSDRKILSSALPDQVSHSILSSTHAAESPRENAFQAVRQNLFQSLGAFLAVPSNGSQVLTKEVFQQLARFLPLPFFQEGLLLSRFLGGKEVSVLLGGQPRPFSPEAQGLIKTFLQGATFLAENPASRGMGQTFPAALRAFFGLFFLRGTEIQIRAVHSALLDELGGLLAQSSRRTRRKEKKRIGRPDRVRRKDQSQAVDPDLQDGDETFIDEIDTWLKSSGRPDEADGFSFYLQ